MENGIYTYKAALENIIETNIRDWIKDKLRRAKINASVTVMNGYFEFEADGPCMNWSCPVILHGYADETHIGAFVDINVTGTIMDRVLIDECQFLDDKKEIIGIYRDNQRIGRFEELYDECAI